MIENIYQGEKVRLVAVEPQKDGELFAAWQRDAEYARLLDSEPVRLWSAGQNKGWLEKQQKSETFDGIEFMIRTLGNDKTIGFIGLDGISWHNGNSWVGIGIGQRDYWSQGYGSDAMRMQGAINGLGHGPSKLRIPVGLTPHGSELIVALASTFRARSVTGGKRGRFIEEKQLGIRALRHNLTLTAVERQRAGYPILMRVSAQDALVRVMQNTAIAHP